MVSHPCLLCSQDTAKERYACWDCAQRLRRWLRDVEQYAVRVAVNLVPLTGDGGRRAPGYTSAPPASLDALVALDLRSHVTSGVCECGQGCGDDDDEDPVRSILGTLHGIARWVRAEQGIERQEAADPEEAEDWADWTPNHKPVTISGEVSYLLGAVEWCCAQQWVDELAGDVGKLHSQCRRLAKDAPPRPLAPCLSIGCGAPVFWTRDVTDPRTGQLMDAARCSGCGRVYQGTSLVRLRTQREAS